MGLYEDFKRKQIEGIFITFLFVLNYELFSILGKTGGDCRRSKLLVLKLNYSGSISNLN
jgi:hypothetical protein